MRELLQKAFLEGYKACSEIVKQEISGRIYGSMYDRILMEMLIDAKGYIDSKFPGNAFEPQEDFRKKRKDE